MTNWEPFLIKILNYLQFYDSGKLLYNFILNELFFKLLASLITQTL